jgi:nucleoside-diphosphate-sugar epimerase
MNSSVSRPAPRTAFVTGATGLLGNKLVRFLIDKEGSPLENQRVVITDTDHLRF